MIKHLVFAAVISTLALSGQPHPGDNSASSTTTSQSQGDRHRLEDEKLRLEVESLRGQATTAERIKDWGAFAQSVATILSFIVGGWWVYAKFVRAQEKYPNIEFSADINVIGQQGGSLIVELNCMCGEQRQGTASDGRTQLRSECASAERSRVGRPMMGWSDQFPPRNMQGGLPSCPLQVFLC